MRRFLLAGVVLLCGCLQLDPFLFAANSSDADVLEPESDDPKEVITPDRISRHRVVVNDAVTLGAVRVAAAVDPALGHVFYFSGQGSTLDNSFGRIKRLANVGFDVFAVNYRGFGSSSAVTPTEAGLAEDVRAALAFFRGLLPLNTPVHYYGRSLGTAIATELAVDEPPARWILESPFASIEALAQDATGMDFPIGFLATVRYDTEARISGVHAPLLLLHGRADDYVRVESGIRVFNAAPEPKQLVLVDGADHSNVPQTMGDNWDETVRNHFVPAP